MEPNNPKITAITETLKPKNLQELRSYLGVVYQMNMFIPKLAKVCNEVRPFQNKTSCLSVKKYTKKRSNCETTNLKFLPY